MGKDERITPINPHGSFEDVRFIKIINKIIKDSPGKNWFDPYDYWINPPKEGDINKVIKEHTSSIREFVDERKEENKL